MVSELDTRRCTSEDVGPRRRVDCENPHQLERGTSVSENAGPEWELIVRSHIDWKEEQVSVRTLGPEGGELWDSTSIEERNECHRGLWAPKVGELWDPTSVGEGNERFFLRVWKSLHRKSVFKPWGKSVEANPKKDSYSCLNGLNI